MSIPFQKILVANRGEIAVRVIRACREMGIRSVAVFSEVDRGALHVRKADEAYAVGPAAATESYLNIERLLEVARRSGAQAIHPGYGFLAENAQFAHACEQAGIKFIGPGAAAMELMGSKTRARAAMHAAGVPLVPGSIQGLHTWPEAERVAGETGYPLMLKASAGGGGKGMRLVRHREELRNAFEAAQSEALRAFSDGEVYIERYVADPRHIEIQILGDEHGNLIHLGERECSVQRRHQKVIEESPSPIVDDEMRRRMGEAAVRVGSAAGYANAGTVEFLVDAERNFYFLEMNTRLQVEHPVTESVTGFDLVQWQIRIAAGEQLPVTQPEMRLRGHAVEARVYAEDPDYNFFPSPGLISRLSTPSGPGIRDDSGIYEGWRVPVEYDPLLSKLIGCGATRAHAIARLRRGLDDYFVGGIATNIALLKRVLDDPDFQAGRIDTGYLDRLLAQPMPAGDIGTSTKVAAIAAALFAYSDQERASRNGNSTRDTPSKWKQAGRQEALRER